MGVEVQSLEFGCWGSASRLRGVEGYQGPDLVGALDRGRRGEARWVLAHESVLALRPFLSGALLAVQGSGFGVQGLGCGVWGVGCRVQGLGFGV